MYPWRTSQGLLVPLRDVAGLWETPQVSERWHNGSEIVSWFAATVMVTAGAIYTLKLQEERVQPKPPTVFPPALPRRRNL
jgi:hypothetical protein